MKNIAVITTSAQEFRSYKNGQIAIGENHNFIHICCIDNLFGNIFNDSVSLTTRFKMPDYEKIISGVKSRTINLN